MEPTSSPLPPSPSKSSYLPKLAVAVVLVAAYAAFAAFKNSNKEQAQPVDLSKEPGGNQTQNTTQEPPKALSPYKDGTYSATGNYISPGGAETISVTLTLKDGIVTAAEVVPQATRPISVTLQNDFAANYKVQVIGKNIEGLQLGKISGSSLTPKGFNNALEQIRTQAKS
jgi:uncharacterized protein with FMN-binding domain